MYNQNMKSINSNSKIMADDLRMVTSDVSSLSRIDDG